MPVVGVPVRLLGERLGRDIAREELIDTLHQMGCDVEGYATLRRYKCARCANIIEVTESQEAPGSCKRCAASFGEEDGRPADRIDLGETDVIRMELLAVRPDMFDPGGLARALRGYLGEQTGPRAYTLRPPEARVTVDPAMLGEGCPRPAIACAVVRNVALDDDVIKVIMNLQENLHWALGRDRKHASIGVYDLSTLAWPEFAYRPVAPDGGAEGLTFVPLGTSDGRSLTPAQVLSEHAKGVEFARLLAGFSAYPLLIDSAGQVLSMPPIINSDETRVKDETAAFFVDVTGTNRRLVSKTLNVLVTSLAEISPQIEIEQVSIAYPEETLVTPDLTPQAVALSTAETTQRIGIAVDDAGLAALLGRMGHDVEITGAGALAVSVPAYRNDILHPCDLMEDAAIAFGYHNIVPALVPTMTVGAERDAERIARVVRDAMTGLGFLEVMTLPLISEERAFDSMRLARADDYAAIDNPISQDQTMLRRALGPGLLETLSVNAHREYPQQLFEVGHVTVLDGDEETGAREEWRVAAVVIGDKAGYTDARGVAEALLRELGWEIETRAGDAVALGSYLPGRGAELVVTVDGTPRIVGHLGEVHPEVLDAFRLRHPTALLELDLSALRP